MNGYSVVILLFLFLLTIIIMMIFIFQIFSKKLLEENPNTLKHISNQDFKQFIDYKKEVKNSLNYLLKQNEITIEKSVIDSECYWVFLYKKKKRMGYGCLHEYNKQLIKFAKYVRKRN